jgi:hypothetical protein
MRFGIICTDTKHGNIPRLELGVNIPKATGFLGASRGVVTGIKIKHNSLSPQICETDKVAICV